MRKIIHEVDVSCRHNADGTIVPLRLRFMNEDGEYETYTIKGCREAAKKGTHTTEDGIYVSDSTFLLFLPIHRDSAHFALLSYEHCRN